MWWGKGGTVDGRESLSPCRKLSSAHPRCESELGKRKLESHHSLHEGIVLLFLLLLLNFFFVISNFHPQTVLFCLGGRLKERKRKKTGRALTISLVNIRPGIFPTHHILDLLPLHLLTLIIPPLDGELIRTSPAFEFILSEGKLVRSRASTDCQAITAAGTDCFLGGRWEEGGTSKRKGSHGPPPPTPKLESASAGKGIFQKKQQGPLLFSLPFNVQRSIALYAGESVDDLDGKPTCRKFLIYVSSTCEWNLCKSTYVQYVLVSAVITTRLLAFDAYS